MIATPMITTAQSAPGEILDALRAYVESLWTDFLVSPADVQIPIALFVIALIIGPLGVAWNNWRADRLKRKRDAAEAEAETRREAYFAERLAKARGADATAGFNAPQPASTSQAEVANDT